MSRRFALAGLTLLLPSVLDAQRTDTAMVPRELASALLSYGSTGLTILVGELPPEFPQVLVPANATVLGATRYRSIARLTSDEPRTSEGRSARSTVIMAFQQPLAAILALDEAPPGARTTTRRHLESAGLRPPSLRPPSYERGFAFAAADDTYGQQNLFCSDSGMVTFNVMPRDGRGSLVRLNYTPTTRNTPCDPEQTERMSRTRMEQIPMPVLRAPDGARGRISGVSSSGSDYQNVDAVLESPLSAIEVMAQYAPQLKQQGWTLETPVADRNAAVQIARRTDERGREIFAVVTDVKSSPNEHLLTLGVRVLPKR